MDILETTLKVGRWLEKQKYVGPDLYLSTRNFKCSTTFGFSARAWLNIYRHTNNEEYLRKAIICGNEILQLQEKDGSWLFPAKFRNNPPNFPLVCEITFTALALPELYIVTQNEKYLKALLKVKDFLLEKNGYFKVNEDIYCMWYSSNDKIRVPNIGSFVGHLFAKLYLLTKDPEDLQFAKGFANFCVISQRPDGSLLYWNPPDEAEMLPGEDYSFDLGGIGKHPSALRRFCSIPYHSLTIFEIADVYNFTRDPKYLAYSLRAAKFLRSIQNENGSFPEMIVDKRWYPKKDKVLLLLYDSLNKIRSKVYARWRPLFSVKNIAWSAKAFLRISQYNKSFYSPTYKTLNYLVDNFIDGSGGVRYRICPSGKQAENERFMRGSAMAFEALSCFIKENTMQKEHQNREQWISKLEQSKER
jgi:hypothetical protein